VGALPFLLFRSGQSWSNMTSFLLSEEVNWLIKRLIVYITAEPTMGKVFTVRR
jgi:hypothetical protein